MRNKRGLIEWVKGRFAADSHHAGLLVMDILIAILCVVMAFSLWYMVFSFADYRDEGYEAYSLQYTISNNRYQDLLERCNINRVLGVGTDEEEYMEYYAVADYYEALVRCYMYESAGDQTAADVWSDQLQDAEVRLGSFIGEKEKIQKLLGIQGIRNGIKY